ncbi:MAG: hypothetical protein FRX48_01874 [Lasallia pustulata]|uniref:Uncharacterized protein n=1 Tax=Lasallia pustulata TaxID=136370 RepID=A0A5M8Q1B6_9LECA|nr:MAG: hypothetical protein FRX48_01874 [Lasallia pustulata]
MASTGTSPRPTPILVFLPSQPHHQPRRAPPARNSCAGRGVLVEEMPTIEEEGKPLQLQPKRRSGSTSTVWSMSSTGSEKGQFLPEQERDEEMYEYI